MGKEGFVKSYLTFFSLESIVKKQRGNLKMDTLINQPNWWGIVIAVILGFFFLLCYETNKTPIIKLGVVFSLAYLGWIWYFLYRLLPFPLVWKIIIATVLMLIVALIIVMLIVITIDEVSQQIDRLIKRLKNSPR